MICTLLAVLASLIAALVLYPWVKELYYSIKIRIMENRSRYL